MPASFAFSVDSPAPEAVGGVTVIDGVPVQRFKKRIICDGVFVKRDKNTGKELWRLPVTPETRAGYANTFKAMKSGGVPVKLMDDTGAFTIDAPHALPTKNHAGAWEKSQAKRLKAMAENVVGETIDLFNEEQPHNGKNWLSAIVEARGQASIDLMTRNKDTSPEIDRCFIGDKEGEAITAISIVANPLVPHQTGFERIAASADSPERFILSLEDEESTMPLAAILSAVALLAGLDASKVTEDNAVATLNGVKAKHAEALTQALSADEPAAPSKTELRACGKLGLAEIKRLSAAGIVSDAGEKELTELLVGKFDAAGYTPSRFVMSADEPDAAVVMLESIANIILKNPGVRKGAVTGVQDTRFMSADDTGGGATKMPTAERIAELLNMTTVGREVVNAARK